MLTVMGDPNVKLGIEEHYGFESVAKMILAVRTINFAFRVEDLLPAQGDKQINMIFPKSIK